MILKKKYIGIDDTMKHIKKQIIDSVDYCLINIPAMEDPRELFYYLKNIVTYKNDPKNIELLQTAQTLIENNFHDIPGAGDCDCFTILTVAAMISQNWDNIYIDLVGRSKSSPVHIYSHIIWNGQRQVLDLTNKQFNQERPYPFKQEIKVNWRKW